MATWQALTKLTKPTHTGLHSNWQFLITLKIHKINLMRTFPDAAKMRLIDFSKPIIFQIERDSLKRNSFIDIILFIVLPKHNENV